jgi:hypothetical protein
MIWGFDQGFMFQNDQNQSSIIVQQVMLAPIEYNNI